jgi:hypothetical protein
MPWNIKSNLLGFVGALIGAMLGLLGYKYALTKGLYAIVLPGGLLGLGCGALARNRSFSRGLICAVAGLGLGFYTEWQSFWNKLSLVEFVQKIPSLDSLTLPLIGLGGLLAFWSGRDHFGAIYSLRRKSMTEVDR